MRNKLTSFNSFVIRKPKKLNADENISIDDLLPSYESNELKDSKSYETNWYSSLKLHMDKILLKNTDRKSVV